MNAYNLHQCSNRIFKLLLFIFIFALDSFKPLMAQLSESDSLAVDRYQRHIASLDYISRKTDNGRFFLELSNQYCDSILSITPDNAYALEFKEKNNLILATCEQNMNHMVQLFPFFDGFPEYLGFADDAVEYAYDDALGKLLTTKYIKLYNGPLGQANIHSIVVAEQCDEEMFEIANQIIIKNTNHFILPKHELNEIIGHKAATELLNGNLTESSLSQICQYYDLEKLGIFSLNDLDIINDKIWLVESKFKTYQKNEGLNSPILSKGFIVDKRTIGVIDIILILLQSIVLITLISFVSLFFNQSFRSSISKTSELINQLLAKFYFVLKSFFIPFILSLVMIWSLAIIIPNPEEHYMEFSAKLWLVLLTLCMTFVPTIVNLYLINRLDLDGFHTIRGYRAFANTSLYATYLPIGLFYFVLYEHQYFAAQVVLIGVTLIIGDLLARSYYQYTAITKNPYVKTQSFIGLIIGVIGLLVVNSLILIKYDIEHLAYSILLVAPLSAFHYFLGRYFEKKYERQKQISQEIEVFDELPFITKVMDPYTSIYEVAKSSMSDQELNVMLISGPAGIGKTRALNESKKHFIKNDWEWFYGDCDEIQKETAVSFEPFLEAFKDLLKIEEFTNRGEQLDAAMGSAVDIGAAIVDIDTSSFVKDYARNDTQKMTEICLEIIDKLERRKKKVVFVMEDLHWVDPESYSFFKTFIQVINRNKFARGNLCIILTIREDEYNNYRGPKLVELRADLEEWQNTTSNKFRLQEILSGEDFKMLDFTLALSSSENKFKIQNSSLAQVNELFNRAINDQIAEAVTPLYVTKVIESWIDNGLLEFSSEGYKLTEPLSIDDLPNDSGIDNFYHNILSKYEDKWGRLLESAAIIGNRFNADLLAKVWNYELLEVLSFLEMAVKDGLLIDVSEEDNIFMFGEPNREGSTKRIVSAIKTFYQGANQVEYNKQIVLEYNKRYIDLHNDVFEEIHLYSNEELLILLRRLLTLLISDPYRKKAEAIVFELVMRLIFFNEIEKLESILSILKKHHQFRESVTIIGNVVKDYSKDSYTSKDSNVGADGITFGNISVGQSLTENLGSVYKLLSISWADNIMLKDGEKSKLNKLILQIKENILSEFNGIVQVELALILYMKGFDNDGKFLESVRNANVLHPEFTTLDTRIELEAQNRLLTETKLNTDQCARNNLALTSEKLVNRLFEETKLNFLSLFIFKLRFDVLSDILDDDNSAILEFRTKLVETELRKDLTWAKTALTFLNSYSAIIYFKKYNEEASELLNGIEQIIYKYYDDEVWDVWVNYVHLAKSKYFLSLKEAESAISECYKIISFAEKNYKVQLSNQYWDACEIAAKSFAVKGDGKKSIEWRLIGINAIEGSLKIFKLAKLIQTGGEENVDDDFWSQSLDWYDEDSGIDSGLWSSVEIKPQLKELSAAYSNLSHAYRNLQNDAENCLKYARLSNRLKSPEEGGGYGVSLYNLGRAYELTQDFEKAIDYYIQAEPYFNNETQKEKYHYLVLKLNHGIALIQLDKKQGLKLLPTIIKQFDKEEIKIYLTPAIKKRVELAQKLVES